MNETLRGIVADHIARLEQEQEQTRWEQQELAARTDAVAARLAELDAQLTAPRAVMPQAPAT